MLNAVGAQRGGSGAKEPIAWILGGDFNCGANFLSIMVGDYQLSNDAGAAIQQLVPGVAKNRHGDIAMVQHLKAYQLLTSVAHTFGGVSDAHDLVVVPIVHHVTARSKDAEKTGAASGGIGQY